MPYPKGMMQQGFLRRRLWLSFAALLWERGWRALWPAVAIAELALGLALLDILPRLPGYGHLVVGLVLILGLGVALERGRRRFIRPTWQDAENRLEDDDPQRPLSALKDSPTSANAGGDRLTSALWREHLARMVARAKALRPKWPMPGVAALDPLGVRAVPVLVLAVGLLAGGSEFSVRVSRAVSPSLPGWGTSVSVELWITPPAYTGLPPLIRTTAAAGEPSQEENASPAQTLTVPEGSRLLMLIKGRSRVEVHFGDDTFVPESLGSESARLEATLPDTGEDRTLSVRSRWRTIAEWPIETVPDVAPSIAFAQTPTAAAGGDGRLAIPIEANDDYGLAEVSLRLSLEGKAEESRLVSLSLGEDNPRRLQRTLTVDLAADPWAGRMVSGILEAKDAAGQTAVSSAHSFVLPERVFIHPVAREVASVRKEVLDRSDRRIALAPVLDRLADRPDTFANDTAVFLGLRVVSLRMRYGNSSAELATIAPLLWSLAVRIEDGALAGARENLAEAQNRLEQAVASGSMEDVRAALKAVRQSLGALLTEMAQFLPSQDMDFGDASPSLGLDVLKNLMDDLDDLSKIGAREAMQQRLRELQTMMEALRSARPLDAASLKEARQTMTALKELVADQKALLERTFAQGIATGATPTSRPRSVVPTPNASGTYRRLAEDQQALFDRLEALRIKAERQAKSPLPALDEAAMAMADAVWSLQQQADDMAQAAQGRALEALTKGQGDAGQVMMRAMGGGMILRPRGGGGAGSDPLGRRAAGQNGDVKIPTQPERTRAWDLLQELRRRVNEGDRSEDEKDYLRRLIAPF